MIIILDGLGDFMDYDINKLVGEMDFYSNHLIDCGNGLMLTNGEISVLKRFDIDYMKCSSLKEVLYNIETILNDDEDDLEELDAVALSIAERDYYQNTNK